MKNNKKTSIFLCDMVHNYLGAGSYMFPLNIGYLAAYANKHMADELDIRLFKYPEMLLEALNCDVPDIMGFSNYTWNADLNAKLAALVKDRRTDTMVVFGGPNINYTEAGKKEFFVTHPSVDFYIPFQGETPFVNLLRNYLDGDRNIAYMKTHKMDGIYSYLPEEGCVIEGDVIKRIKDPDEIPSPYLTGLLDKFFEYNLIPIVETNRGCPYQCTFCAQGFSSHHKIDFFSIERVKAEMDYIADHVKNTNLLNLADSNFGIAKRDIEIAKHIANMEIKKGYPRKCNTNWAKNQPKIFEIAKILKNISMPISLQSLDKKVLENVNRQNISISVFKDIIKRIDESGGMSGTEIILGLPGETRDSHIQTLRQLFDWDVSSIICYNGLVLDGTEMSAAKENGKFRCSTKFRLIDSSFGEYGDFVSFEGEEGILSTDTMSEDELLSFRPVHWLIQFLWNYRFYYDLLKYIQSCGVNPLDYILEVIELSDSVGSDNVKAVFSQFREEAKNEWFNSQEALQEYYSRPENFEMLKNGLFGKMNGKYVFRVLLEMKAEFESYLCDIVSRTIVDSEQETAGQIVVFLSASIIDFNQSWEEICREKIVHCMYDITAWRESNYEKDINAFYDPVGFEFRFYLSKEQETSLRKLMIQYDHANKNVTLRKMSEFMSINDCFYKIDRVHVEEIGVAAGKTEQSEGI